MSRGGIFLALGVVLCAVAWAAAPPVRLRATGRTVSPAEAVYQVIDFDGLDDKGATLQDVLEGLTKQTGVQFRANEIAFKVEGLNEVARAEVGAPPLPKMRARLGTVLGKILDRVPIPSGAAWLVRADCVEVTTARAVAQEVFPDWSPPRLTFDDGEASPTLVLPDLVHADFSRTPTGQALALIGERTDRNIVLDGAVEERKAATPVTFRLRNVPVDTAVLLVASQAGLQVVRLDNVYYVTTAERAAAVARNHAHFRPAPPRKGTR